MSAGCALFHMSLAQRVKFFVPVRKREAQTQTDSMRPEKSPPPTVIDRLRASDADWLLQRDPIPSTPIARALVKGFNTRLGFYYTTLNDTKFDALTPPPDLFSDLPIGLVFNFYDTQFFVNIPGTDSTQHCFSYSENIFNVLECLETGILSRELAVIIDKLAPRACAYTNGEMVVLVNDYRYGEEARTWRRKLVIGDDVILHYCLSRANDTEQQETEQAIALARHPVLCTDPSPDVARAKSACDFRSKMWTSRRRRIREEVEQPPAPAPRPQNNCRIVMDKFHSRCQWQNDMSITPY